MKKTSEKIKVDGVLDDPTWQNTARTKSFWQHFPMDSLKSETSTEVMITYDKQFIYVAFKVIDPKPGPWVTTSLRRDFSGTHNDLVSVVFDPFQDQTNGMLFGINPFGVQREALVSGLSGGSGGSSGFDLSWDNKWFSGAKMHEGYWTAEMAIPFKTLRYQGGSQIWKANFFRIDSKTAEQSSWGMIPRNQSIISVAFSGDIIFEEPLEKPGPNIALIPYVSGSSVTDYIEDGESENKFNFGGDAKIGITPSLNLDLTINPDFSQVEADVQQTNLTRFELFYPERRQFFLENQDIFASFGSSRIRPFFSRRIGIALDPNTGVNVQNPIHYGARLSGRVNEKWRMGVMNMQTAKDASISQPGYNYSVLALQRQVFARSNISIIGINKQATHVFDGDSTLTPGIASNNYNRLAGIDYNLASQDNKWTGKFFYHQSFSTENNKDAFSHGANLIYNSPAVRLEWNHQIVGKNFNPEVGFAPRKDYKRLAPTAQYTFYPNNKIAKHGPGIEAEYIWNETYGKTDHRYTLFYEFRFANNASMNLGVQNEYTYLFRDFDPTRSGGVPLPEGSDHSYSSVGGSFSSDQRKKFYFAAETILGEYYNGDLFSIKGDINYRFQPFGIASLNFSYNKINLPEPHSSGNIILVGPRFDITFSRSVFLTTFFQYNDQIDNVNINARLQYRFKPVSDFYLVYTDNYYSTDFTTKNRAIVAKLTYWFNL
ncbi:DUF5916 domain-containing protein [Flammeovirgaceae bacterium SG7u.111]|nr:DUF5916 domain-containing protein [Flammeovirgaceae bacterium SG7u.132]WPO35877.1 DUF5916 domain-containing protein [Flammeovirgaceae bacterium SG7u.111]